MVKNLIKIRHTDDLYHTVSPSIMIYLSDSKKVKQLNLTRKDFLAEGEKFIREATLLSETDIFGTIIFVNDDFCHVAKYKREELIGKAHNIIRHPDMPKKLFTILWSTIQSGSVFRGIIKNRAKDNSHYWVQAIIMPILDNDQKIIKFLGVRHHIKNDSLAEELYQYQVKELRLEDHQ